ncbi:MAG: hypothetical protein ACXW3Z_02610 [Limisphaerales bacterium]
MAAEFTPIFPALKGKVTAGTEFLHRSSFAPLATPPGAPAQPSSSAPPPHRAVQIELQRDGERISQLRVQCRCGEWIEIECEY